MKGKYKAAIALVLVLVLLPLTLLLTLTHWVPTLAGIWLLWALVSRCRRARV